ncbi:Uncharacterised protein [uncultured Clostridium sp.]|nr:Uncharacterised protein [uncultured Clostridium sp.]
MAATAPAINAAGVVNASPANPKAVGINSIHPITFAIAPVIAPQFPAIKKATIPEINPPIIDNIISLCFFIKLVIFLNTLRTLSAKASTFPVKESNELSC